MDAHNCRILIRSMTMVRDNGIKLFDSQIVQKVFTHWRWVREIDSKTRTMELHFVVELIVFYRSKKPMLTSMEKGITSKWSFFRIPTRITWIPTSLSHSNFLRISIQCQWIWGIWIPCLHSQMLHIQCCQILGNQNHKVLSQKFQTKILKLRTKSHWFINYLCLSADCLTTSCPNTRQSVLNAQFWNVTWARTLHGTGTNAADLYSSAPDIQNGILVTDSGYSLFREIAWFDCELVIT
jgi:hypothetical protein